MANFSAVPLNVYVTDWSWLWRLENYDENCYNQVWWHGFVEHICGYKCKNIFELLCHGPGNTGKHGNPVTVRQRVTHLRMNSIARYSVDTIWTPTIHILLAAKFSIECYEILIDVCILVLGSGVQETTCRFGAKP